MEGISDGKWTRIRVTPLHSHQSLNSEGGEDERKGMGGKKKKKKNIALNPSKSGKQQRKDEEEEARDKEEVKESFLPSPPSSELTGGSLEVLEVWI